MGVSRGRHKLCASSACCSQAPSAQPSETGESLEGLWCLNYLVRHLHARGLICQLQMRSPDLRQVMPGHIAACACPFFCSATCSNPEFVCDKKAGARFAALLKQAFCMHYGVCIVPVDHEHVS